MKTATSKIVKPATFNIVLTEVLNGFREIRHSAYGEWLKDAIPGVIESIPHRGLDNDQVAQEVFYRICYPKKSPPEPIRNAVHYLRRVAKRVIRAEQAKSHFEPLPHAGLPGKHVYPEAWVVERMKELEPGLAAKLGLLAVEILNRRMRRQTYREIARDLQVPQSMVNILGAKTTKYICDVLGVRFPNKGKDANDAPREQPRPAINSSEFELVTLRYRRFRSDLPTSPTTAEVTMRGDQLHSAKEYGGWDDGHDFVPLPGELALLRQLVATGHNSVKHALVVDLATLSDAPFFFTSQAPPLFCYPSYEEVIYSESEVADLVKREPASAHEFILVNPSDGLTKTYADFLRSRIR